MKNKGTAVAIFFVVVVFHCKNLCAEYLEHALWKKEYRY